MIASLVYYIMPIDVLVYRWYRPVGDERVYFCDEADKPSPIQGDHQRLYTDTHLVKLIKRLKQTTPRMWIASSYLFKLRNTHKIFSRSLYIQNVIYLRRMIFPLEIHTRVWLDPTLFLASSVFLSWDHSLSELCYVKPGENGHPCRPFPHQRQSQ